MEVPRSIFEKGEGGGGETARAQDGSKVLIIYIVQYFFVEEKMLSI